MSQPNGGRDKMPEKNTKMATTKTKKEIRKEQAIKANELLKTCPKEQAKLARQLRKLGLL